MAVVDFIARKPDGRVVLVVEAKNKRQTTVKWAAEVRRNLMSHLHVDAAFFLLATPDRLYFWLNGDSKDAIPPAVSIDAQDILRPYIQSAQLGSDRLSGPGFELVVSSWLRELLGSERAAALASYPAPLHEAGFFDAMRGSVLSYQPNV